MKTFAFIACCFVAAFIQVESLKCRQELSQLTEMGIKGTDETGCDYCAKVDDGMNVNQICAIDSGKDYSALMDEQVAASQSQDMGRAMKNLQEMYGMSCKYAAMSGDTDSCCKVDMCNA